MKRIAVSSFKGGTAKTSTTLNVAATFAKFHKKKVLVVDFDAQANLTAGLGFDPDAHESLAPVLQGTKEIQEVILKTGTRNLDLIPADTWLERVEVTGSLAADRYSHERLSKVLEPLDYDIVIIDTPPSLCWLTESALIAADHSLICVTPEFYSIKGLQRLAHFMESISERHPSTILGVALSFWNPRGKSNQAFVDVVNDTFPGKLLESKVRRDVCVSEASIHGKPVFDVAPKSRATEDFHALSKELLNRMQP
ncbi:MAG: Sporulation initiation inhibitor protein Soj [Chlamydiae bacterium]|nr:Sporulation initiation inhibitor protein Soj [Chlamydiota bacterium]